MSESPLLTPLDLDEFRTGNAFRNLEAVVAEIRSYCGWHIAPVRTEALTLQASAGIVVLPTLHATSATVAIDGTALEASEYELEPGLLRLTGYRRGCGTVTVNLTHGYAELPADLRHVALALANAGTSFGARLKSVGPFTYEFDGRSSEQDTIDRYRLAPRP